MKIEETNEEMALTANHVEWSSLFAKMKEGKKRKIILMQGEVYIDTSN